MKVFNELDSEKRISHKQLRAILEKHFFSSIHSIDMITEAEQHYVQQGFRKALYTIAKEISKQ